MENCEIHPQVISNGIIRADCFPDHSTIVIPAGEVGCITDIRPNRYAGGADAPRHIRVMFEHCELYVYESEIN